MHGELSSIWKVFASCWDRVKRYSTGWLGVLFVTAMIGPVLYFASTAPDVDAQDDAARAAVERMAINLDALEVERLERLTGADGSGVRIAIIDTGIDLSHPAFRFTPSGDRKVVDW